MEEYVTPVAALMAKELGFSWETWTHYDISNVKELQTNITKDNWNNDISKASAPTQEVMNKWVRETFNCFIWVFSEDGGKSYGWEIDEMHKDFYKTLPEDDDIKIMEYNFTSYELAFGDALDHSLKLIHDTNKTSGESN